MKEGRQEGMKGGKDGRRRNNMKGKGRKFQKGRKENASAHQLPWWRHTLCRNRPEKQNSDGARGRGRTAWDSQTCWTDLENDRWDSIPVSGTEKE